MEYSIKFHKALNALKPNVEYTYHNETPMTEELFNQMNWVIGVNENQTAKTTKDNPHSELTWEKVSAEMERIQAEYDAQDYARDRAKAYPPIQDQLDYIYHNSITKWKSDMIKPVKDAHPKP